MEQPRVSPEPQAQTSTSQAEIDQERERYLKLTEEMSITDEGQRVNLLLRSKISADFTRISLGLSSKENDEDKIRVVDYMSFKPAAERHPTPNEILLFSRVSEIHPEVDLNLRSRIRAAILEEIATQRSRLADIRQVLEEINEPKL